MEFIERIQAYRTETVAFISAHDYNFLIDSDKEKCKPVNILIDIDILPTNPNNEPSTERD